MTGTASLRINGAELVADPSGALWWPARDTLVVADLHFEKGSYLAAAGSMLPPYDTAETLRRLEGLVDRLRPGRVIALGDSFHDAKAEGRLAPEHGSRLATVVARTDWVWIAGNHDPIPAGPWGGRVEETLVDGPLVFRHEAVEGDAPGEISGHFHPKAAVIVRSRYISSRCFVGDPHRLILPAFGAYAGGLDVLDPAIRRHFRKGFLAHLLGRAKIVALPHHRLLPSRI